MPFKKVNVFYQLIKKIMALSKGKHPEFNTMTLEAVTILPAATQGSGNSIASGVRVARLGANVNDVNDFTVLPSLATVPSGHTITIIAGAANSELRTPASSAEEINSEDCDGTKEALLTATNIYTVTKIDNTIGWMLEGRTAIGAYETAIIPD
jgi:hypothetical protein